MDSATTSATALQGPTHQIEINFGLTSLLFTTGRVSARVSVSVSVSVSVRVRVRMSVGEFKSIEPA